MARQRLLTKALMNKVPRLYSLEKLPDDQKKVPIKFFNPTGSGTWYVLEADVILKNGTRIALREMHTIHSGLIDDIQFFGYVDLHEKEFGYFSYNELCSVKGQFGLGIERDRHWDPNTTIKDVLDGKKR